MTTQVQEVSGNGARTTRPVDLRLEPARRRVRLPEMAVGLIVVLGFALAAVLWQLNAVQKDPVLALANDVSRGEVIEADDVRVVYVASDDPIAHLASSQSATVVGRIARSDLPAGALLTRDAVSDGPAVEAGQGVVGLALEPGQVPSSRLRTGDLVNVVTAGAPTTSASSSTDEVIVERAEVFAVEELTASGRLFVSLKASEADANKVAAAAERGPVRLVMVG